MKFQQIVATLFHLGLREGSRLLLALKPLIVLTICAGVPSAKLTETLSFNIYLC